MAKTIISEGKTTNEAIEKGIKELNVSRKMVDVKVLENEDKRSFFSILAPRVVKVELTLKEDIHENKPKREIVLSEEEQEMVENNIKSFLNKLKPELPEDTTYNIRKTQNAVYVDLKSPNLGYLIGYRGETLYAFQNILTAIAGKGIEDGVNVKEVRQKDLRDIIGIVPQKGMLFSGTIESNIKYADENMSDEKMIQAAEIAQATEFISKKPKGYKDEIAQGGSNVSGGQKQRLAIARAIAKDPEIFIFDDSFSALDLKTDAQLREALATKTKNKTVIIVAQRISTILNADKIVVLDEGSIVGIGTHKELMETNETYRTIALSQMSEEELKQEGSDK